MFENSPAENRSQTTLPQGATRMWLSFGLTSELFMCSTQVSWANRYETPSTDLDDKAVQRCIFTGSNFAIDVTQ
ncbi:hypothetical protein J6590_100208 [Homalodisca vitripennis]|nr:hypothetical protein J6590_100208 [Homalodisca vitripennis]